MSSKKVFIKYSYKDVDFAKQINNCLITSGYQVCFEPEQTFKDIELFEQAINDYDSANIILLILTNNCIDYINDKILLDKDVLFSGKLLFTIIVGKVFIPSYISNCFDDIYKLESIMEFNKNELLDKINNIPLNNNKLENINPKKISYDNYENFISEIKRALESKNLTLVCGAGLSMELGLPDWNTLLTEMFKIAFFPMCKNLSEKDIKNLLKSPDLIVGKYLKICLNEKFDSTLFHCLYSNLNISYENIDSKFPLMSSIIKLLRFQNKGIKSVITFNFDSLLEEFLSYNLIKHKVIYDENIKHSTDELPIYHVHGYLPLNNSVEKHNIVFSEDSYHTQFVDLYSWSNLEQLYTYINNTCLFIGISLTDPNLRRLLDISNRKKEGNKHFIIKKLPAQNSPTYNLEIMLQEQDAYKLGLNVIWLSNHNEYPLFLKKLI